MDDRCVSCNKKNYTTWEWCTVACKIYDRMYTTVHRAYRCPVSEYWHIMTLRKKPNGKERRRIRRRLYRQLASMLRSLHDSKARTDEL